MKLIAIHGSTQHELEIPAENHERNGENESSSGASSNGPVTLSHIKERIAEVSNVPPENQRIIIKGKTVFDNNLSLKQLKLKNGDKIMVLSSKPPEAKVDEELALLQAIESSSVKKSTALLQEINSEVDGIEKGFLPPDLLTKALEKIHKQMRQLHEECMQILFKLDGIVFSETSSSQARAKRKQLVNDVQAQLAQQDVILERVSALGKQLVVVSPNKELALME